MPAPPESAGPSLRKALSWMAVAASVLLVGADVLVHMRTSSKRELWEPAPIPDQVYPDEYRILQREGESILMLSEPHSWQKRAPCDIKQGEKEKVGECWLKIDDAHPPCPEYAVESDGECFVPIPTKPKRKVPSAKVPEKP